MRDQKKIRILIVDDHYFVRVGLAECIQMESDMAVVAEAANGMQALAACRKEQPDVALVDLLLPGMSGVEITEIIRKDWPETKVIIVSTYDGEDDIYRAFQAGATGYLLKSMEREALIEAVRTVYGGRNYVPPAVAERLSRRLPRRNLTARELEVLRLVARGLSNKEIGATLDITEGTVKLHVSKVLGKLKVADRTQATTAALQSGLLHLE